MKHLRIIVLVMLSSLIFSCPSWSAVEEYVITIKDHTFDPEELIIPEKTKVKLGIINEDSTVEEFESFDLNREKIVPGHGKIIIFIGPLKSGEYKYFGEFHQDTAQGKIIVQ